MQKNSVKTAVGNLLQSQRKIYSEVPASTFDQILAKGARQGILPARTEDARRWFRDQAKRSNVTAEKLHAESKAAFTKSVSVGRMYMFFYDPKHKKTLPYYDRFPLIFPFKGESDGFYGINLHYLPPKLRAMLMDGLYDLLSNKKYDETTKLRLSYNVLNGASKYKWFKPCVKRYLSRHVRSRFIEVNVNEWDMALMLPTQKFQGASTAKVWRDSRNAV